MFASASRIFDRVSVCVCMCKKEFVSFCRMSTRDADEMQLAVCEWEWLCLLAWRPTERALVLCMRQMAKITHSFFHSRSFSRQRKNISFLTISELLLRWCGRAHTCNCFLWTVANVCESAICFFFALVWSDNVDDGDIFFCCTFSLFGCACERTNASMQKLVRLYTNASYVLILFSFVSVTFFLKFAAVCGWMSSECVIPFCFALFVHISFLVCCSFHSFVFANSKMRSHGRMNETSACIEWQNCNSSHCD